MERKKAERVSELWAKPKSYQFTDEEIQFLKSQLPKSGWRAKYALYTKNSKKDCYIGFIIDGIPGSPRRSSYENYWNFICERELSEKEYLEQLKNWGTDRRRFQVWLYRNIEFLQKEDLDYGITTPEKFVKLCKEKGYSDSYQLAMKFNET